LNTVYNLDHLLYVEERDRTRSLY